MPEKCYPCTRTYLLPMYLDYTPNSRLQRTRPARVVPSALLFRVGRAAEAQVR